MTPYQEYIQLTSEEKAIFIASRTDSETKAQQLLDAMNEECRVTRKQEYDKLNQLEMIYDDRVNNTSVWTSAIEGIKQQFPKL